MSDKCNNESPNSVTDQPRVLLAHGGGGKLMHQLIEKVFATAFRNPLLDQQHDGAVFAFGGSRLAFSTDSFVVRPLFFPGGDIGQLAVHGTVNDIAMCGARPLYLSAGFIIEEGFPMADLLRVVASMREAAAAAGVQIVTGDTKVVDKGKGDGVFINTAGIGVIEHDLVISPKSVKIGDAILVNGDIGRHGIAIMTARENLDFESSIESDSAALNGLVQELLDAKIDIHCLRDATRGGVATTLNEIAAAANVSIRLDESRIPVREEVKGACELLGFDPLYVANEGRMTVFVAAKDAERALEIMRSHPQGQGSSIIGSVEESPAGLVTMRSQIGATRIVDMLSGEQLPRIC